MAEDEDREIARRAHAFALAARAHDLESRVRVLEREAERRRNSLVTLLLDAADVAERSGDLDTRDVLRFLQGCQFFDRSSALQAIAAAARKAEKTHPALLRATRPPDWTGALREAISKRGPPPGAAVRQLALQLRRALVDSNPDKNSDLYCSHEEGYLDTPIALVGLEIESIVGALPKRLIVNGRIYVSSEVAHRDGASPRKGERLCRCAACEAERILSAAERAMRPLTFPRPRKNAK